MAAPLRGAGRAWQQQEMSIESPCVKICVIDPGTGFCQGCGRTGAEIGAWMSFSPAERRQIMAGLPERMKLIAARSGRCVAPRRAG
jgi:predicted Fe-S protein YdhL (DUF1289 family)